MASSKNAKNILGRPRTYNEAKEYQSVTISTVGWSLLSATVKSFKIRSVGDLIDQISRLPLGYILEFYYQVNWPDQNGEPVVFENKKNKVFMVTPTGWNKIRQISYILGFGGISEFLEFFARCPSEIIQNLLSDKPDNYQSEFIKNHQIIIEVIVDLYDLNPSSRSSFEDAKFIFNSTKR